MARPDGAEAWLARPWQDGVPVLGPGRRAAPMRPAPVRLLLGHWSTHWERALPGQRVPLVRQVNWVSTVFDWPTPQGAKNQAPRRPLAGHEQPGLLAPELPRRVEWAGMETATATAIVPAPVGRQNARWGVPTLAVPVGARQQLERPRGQPPRHWLTSPAFGHA